MLDGSWSVTVAAHSLCPADEVARPIFQLVVFRADKNIAFRHIAARFVGAVGRRCTANDFPRVAFQCRTVDGARVTLTVCCTVWQANEADPGESGAPKRHGASQGHSPSQHPLLFRLSRMFAGLLLRMNPDEHPKASQLAVHCSEESQPGAGQDTKKRNHRLRSTREHFGC